MHISSSGPHWSTPSTKLPPNNSQNFVDPSLAMSPVCCFPTACSTAYLTLKYNHSHKTWLPPSYWDSTWHTTSSPWNMNEGAMSLQGLPVWPIWCSQGIHRTSCLLQRDSLIWTTACGILFFVFSQSEQHPSLPRFGTGHLLSALVSKSCGYLNVVVSE